MEGQLVSIVITTKNEEKNIERCIKSILHQTYKNIELIVVDNASEDKTKELAKKYTTEVYDKGPERSAQRNYGMIDIARGDFVMFIDCDMMLSPYLVDDCVMTMNKGNFLALHIPEIVLGRSFFSKVRRFERSFYNGTVIDGARFFTKETFVKVGGFDIEFSGPEDWDIDKKIKRIGTIGLLKTNIYKTLPSAWEEEFYDFLLDRGVNAKKDSSCIYHNESEFDIGNYLKKKSYYSSSFEGYVKKWGADDPDIKKQLGFGYRFAGVFFEKGKWLKMIIHPLLFIGMYFLRFLVGVVYILRKRNK